MLAAAIAGADCAVLGRMPKIHDDVAQPLAALLNSPSPTEGYSFSLAGGFQAVVERSNGRSRLKKLHQKERKMSRAGTLQYGTLHDLARAHAALDFFAQQKALSLAEQGQANSFAKPGVMEFFHELLERSQHMPEPLLEMAELSVGGRTRAVAGSAIHRGRMNVNFITFAKDELASCSPGQLLTYKHIAECCERGIVGYDLGVGHEDFKTHWCDVVHELNDLYVAFTSLGTVAVAALRLGRATKDRMRRNQTLWRHLKSARAYLSRRVSE